MVTKANKIASKTRTEEESLLAMERLGEAQGEGSNAQYKSCLYFSEIANTDSPLGDDALKAKATTYAKRYAIGQERKSGEKVSEKSVETYAAQMKLFAAKEVYQNLETLEKATNEFIAATTKEERGDRKFFPLIKAAASRVRKSEGKAEINPGLFQDICKAKVTTPPTPEKAKAARGLAFKMACLELFNAGELKAESHAGLIAIAAHVGVALEFETPKAEAPAAPADLAAMIAAAVAQALAAAGK